MCTAMFILAAEIDSDHQNPLSLNMASLKLDLHQRSMACTPHSAHRCSNVHSHSNKVHEAPSKRNAHLNDSDESSTANQEVGSTSSGAGNMPGTQSMLPLISSSYAMNEGEDEMSLDQEGSGDAPVLATAAIAVITVGVIFFVALIVLLFVLFFCIYSKKSSKNMFVIKVPESRGE